MPVSPLKKPCVVANYFNVLTQFVVTVCGYILLVLTKLAPDDLKTHVKFTNGAS